MGLSIYSKTGRLTHFLAYSNSSRAVIIMMTRSGYLLVATSVNSIPFMNGIDISTKAISGFISSITLIASIPLAASPTTSISRLCQSIEAIISLRAELSSSISITLYIFIILLFDFLLSFSLSVNWF